ncbi:MAG: Ig-like domain-containing protein [Gemmatimonadales bacterium]
MPFTYTLSRRLALIKSPYLVGVAAAIVVACNLERRTGPEPVYPLDHISLYPPSLILQVNQPADLAAVGINVIGDTNNVPLRWRLTGGGLTDTFTLERVHYGRYKAGSVGDFLIIVSTLAGEPADTTFVSVRNIAVDTVIVSPDGATFFEGTQTPFTATPLDSAGNLLTGRTIAWMSGNPAVASVTSTGLVTAVAAGSATITATADGTPGTALVTVSTVPVASVSVTPAAASISTGGTTPLTATPRDSAGNPLTGRPVTWSSSAPSVASVNSSGLVTGIGAGSATITATSEGQSGTSAITVTVAPVASVTVTPTSASVLVSGAVQLTATPRDSAGNSLTGRTITWASSAPAVATVSGSGLVSAVAVGSATVTATSEGKSGSSAITVSNVPVASVTVTPSSASVPEGGTVQLTATATDSAGNPLTGRVVTWSSNAPAKATVDANGLVTGVAAGSATITATSETKSGTSAITVTIVPVASVTVSPSTAGVYVGGTVQLTATPQDSAGNPLTGRAVTWSSSDPSKATVSSNGLVDGVAVGSATVTAMSEAKTGTSAITVSLVPVAAVTVTPASASVIVGGTVQLTATPQDSAGNQLSGRAVTWSSSDTTKAKVNGSGLVTGIAVGAATITATSEGKSGTSSITVTLVPVASVTVTPASAGIYVGGTVQLTATPKDSAGTSLTGRVVTWSSSDTTKAKVNGSGLVTGVAAGSATITATCEGKNGTASITVTLVPVASVTVTPASASIEVAGTVQLTATPKDSAGNALTGRAVTWSTNAPAVATVSSSGLVTGIAAGSATITATSEGKSGTSSITVTAPTLPPAPVALCTDTVAPGVPPALRTFYVDAANGNDAAAGTSASTAWRTLAKANAVAQPGDLFLLSGTFVGQIIHPSVSGTALAKIVYRAKPGAAAVISGGQYGVIVWLDGLSHIVVDGLELTNESYIALLRYGTNNVWLRNLYIHDAGSVGIQVVTASDNRIEDNRIERIGSEASNSGEAIFIQNGSHRNRIVRNRVAYAGHGALWISYQSASEATSDDNVLESNDFSNPWASGIGVSGKTNRTIVQCNKIHHTADGTGVNYPRAGVEIEGNANIVRFNEIYRTGSQGITIQGRTLFGFTQNATNNQVYHNTLWQNGRSGSGESIQLIQMDVGNVQNNVIENNIFWNDRGFAWGGLVYAITADMYHATYPWPAGTANGNIVRHTNISSGQAMVLVIRQSIPNESYSIAQAQSQFPGWASSLQLNPLFVNEASDNVQLQSGSPMIDMGRILSGISYLGLAPDLGRYELR